MLTRVIEEFLCFTESWCCDAPAPCQGRDVVTVGWPPGGSGWGKMDFFEQREQFAQCFIPLLPFRLCFPPPGHTRAAWRSPEQVLCCFSTVTLQTAKTNKEIMNVCTLKASHGPSPANTSPSRAQIQLLHNLISMQKQSGRRYKGSLKARFIKGIFI